MKNLYLFRHGQSIWNIEHRVQGQKNDVPIPLSAQGIEDAKTIAPRLKDKNIELIISSDLMRAKQTGEQVAHDLNLAIEFDIRLREINFGDAEGMLSFEADINFPDIPEALIKNHDIVLANSGESINQVKSRICNFLLDICQNRAESNIALSAHGGVIGNFVSTLNGGEYLQLHNADIVHIIYDENNQSFSYSGLIE